MPEVLDLFSDEAFSVASLAEAINDQQYLPGRIGQLGLFAEGGVTTTNVIIERKGNTIRLVPTTPRGSDGMRERSEKAKMRSLLVPHIKQGWSIMADEVQNIKGFGQQTLLQSLQAYVNDRLMAVGQNLEATLEYHRIGAIKGQILDSDGLTVIYNLFTEFGLAKQTHDLVLGTATTKVRVKLNEAKRKAEDKLGNIAHRGFRVFCSAGFYDAFTGHAMVEEAFERYQNGSFLRDDNRSGFEYNGIIFEEYRGSVGGVDFIPAGKAYMVPDGVPGLFKTKFAPADYVETVNTMGLPKYAKQQPLKFNRGIDGEAQTNPLCYCERPDTIIELS